MINVSRTVKCRVWDGQKMIYPHQVYSVDLAINKVGGWCLWDTYSTPHKLLAGEFDLPKLELMLFTGIKDKNGTEIYDGDVIRYLTGGNEYESEVFYSEECACYLVKEPAEMLLDHAKRHAVVIGNIFYCKEDTNEHSM